MRKITLSLLAAVAIASPLSAQTRTEGPWWPHPIWGPDDQAGGSNWITPEKVLDAPASIGVVTLRACPDERERQPLHRRDRLDRGQGVLDPVREFPDQQRLHLLGLAALGAVAHDLHEADQPLASRQQQLSEELARARENPATTPASDVKDLETELAIVDNQIAGALLERSGFGVERTHHVLAEHNPFGLWQSLVSRANALFQGATRTTMLLGASGASAAAWSSRTCSSYVTTSVSTPARWWLPR